ncbi:MAG TPA: hypothetical protein VFI31_06555 [Pirellulales bacterium]|nr:hypothetical protein [Pirellulales bacterium]
MSLGTPTHTTINAWQSENDSGWIMALRRDRQTLFKLLFAAVFTTLLLVAVKTARDLMLAGAPPLEVYATLGPLFGNIFLAYLFYRFALAGLERSHEHRAWLRRAKREVIDARAAIQSQYVRHTTPRTLLFAYKVKETPLGVWRDFSSVQTGFFVEFVSHKRLFGLPLLHYTRGWCPETETASWALGVVAIGRKAAGVIAIGQISVGVVAVGQLAIGVMFGLGQGASGILAIGQATTGIVAIGQFAIGVAFGLGQIATGFVAIGQGAAGVYVLAMIGGGVYVCDMFGCSAVAKQFFQAFIP